MENTDKSDVPKNNRPPNIENAILAGDYFNQLLALLLPPKTTAPSEAVSIFTENGEDL
jgi:hypothetical protein